MNEPKSATKSLKQSLSKSRLFRLFDVSKSGYYDWIKRQPSVLSLVNDELDQYIERIYRQHSGASKCRLIFCPSIRGQIKPT